MSRLERLAAAGWARFDAFMARPRYKADPETYGPGGFFDRDSYLATLRGVAISVLIIYCGRHLDSWSVWLWALFSEELHVRPGEAQWHARVAFAIGSVTLGVEVLRLRHTYATRHQRRAQQAQLEAEITERRMEQRIKAGLPIDTELDTETRLRDAIRRWPIVHDLLWGWPMLLALTTLWLTDPVSALTAIFLGAIVYAINHHALSKRSGRLGLRLTLAAALGGLALGIWLTFAPAITGVPVPDARNLQPKNISAPQKQHRRDMAAQPNPEETKKTKPSLPQI